jgi:hypothetical protein
MAVAFAGFSRFEFRILVIGIYLLFGNYKGGFASGFAFGYDPTGRSVYFIKLGYFLQHHTVGAAVSRKA